VLFTGKRKKVGRFFFNLKKNSIFGQEIAKNCAKQGWPWEGYEEIRKLRWQQLGLYQIKTIPYGPKEIKL